MHLKSFTVVGEKNKNYLSEMAKMHLKSSPVVGEKFENYSSRKTKMHLKRSTMVRETFKNYLSKMAKMHLKSIEYNASPVQTMHSYNTVKNHFECVLWLFSKI